MLGVFLDHQRFTLYVLRHSVQCAIDRANVNVNPAEVCIATKFVRIFFLSTMDSTYSKSPSVDRAMQHRTDYTRRQSLIRSSCMDLCPKQQSPDYRQYLLNPRIRHIDSIDWLSICNCNLPTSQTLYGDFLHSTFFWLCMMRMGREREQFRST